MKFDEYGMPHITPQEERDSACLLETMRPACDFQTGRGTELDVFDLREVQILNGNMMDDFGLCARCWIPLMQSGQRRAPAEGDTEVHLVRGDEAIGIYGVPKKAARSLETLFQKQRANPVDDSVYMQIRYSGREHLEWESEACSRRVALYPWKYWRQKSESAQR